MVNPPPPVLPPPVPQLPGGGAVLPSDGTPPAPPPPDPVPPTDPDVHITPDGPVGGPGQGPAPTLQDMAREMGRQESKLNLLLARPPGGGGDGGGGGLPPDFPDLSGLLDLLQLLASIDGPGGYQLQGPCETGPDGQPVPPRVADWGPSIGLESAIVKRLDALAELLQAHKDLRQPICTPGRAVGQPVTVTFQEIEPE